MQTLAQILQQAAELGVARIDAQMLLLHACGRPAQDRAWLASHGTDAIVPSQQLAWQQLLKRRVAGEPVAYILGYKEFYGLRLAVSPAVLDPRDDTETLVDWALALIPKDQPRKVLDLGTGSGAVALAVCSHRPLAQVIATDASSEALDVACANAAALAFKVQFTLADASHPDWFACLEGESFDLIISNPPYIAEGDPHLTALTHEPALALTSGKDGLDAIRSIVANASRHLMLGGWLLLEHGYDQAERVRHLFTAQGFVKATTRQDLGGVDRCTGAQLNQ